MSGDVIATLDDLAAMLGFYEPIPVGQAAHLAGPLVVWRTHPKQPTFERIDEVERLAYKQRALLAFGGGKPGQMVGSAEIVIACGNLVQGTSPPEYWDLFQWASLDVLSILTGNPPETILADPGKKAWRLIPDDEVLTPGGRLYPTYQIVSTTIRREAIAAMDKRGAIDGDRPDLVGFGAGTRRRGLNDRSEHRMCSFGLGGFASASRVAG